MPKVRPRSAFVAPCIPTRALKPPAGPEWVQEIKHDGYRLQVRRDGDVVRLFTRKGYDWSDRYPAIAITATQLRARSFTLDGEAVVCGPDGVAIFDALHRRGTVTEAMLYAFGLLELDGEDLRGMPLGDRKNAWRGYWAGAASASCSATTLTRTAPCCSCTPVAWASRASCRRS
jgi:bifunctional non-homologous end joining protein LigD